MGGVMNHGKKKKENKKIKNKHIIGKKIVVLMIMILRITMIARSDNDIKFRRTSTEPITKKYKTFLPTATDILSLN